MLLTNALMKAYGAVKVIYRPDQAKGRIIVRALGNDNDYDSMVNDYRVLFLKEGCDLKKAGTPEAVKDRFGELL